MRARAAVLCAIAALACGGAAARADPVSGSCGICHSAERVEFARSSHAGEDVTCVSCHGGNPRVMTEAGAHAGFTGHVNRRDVPRLCASCHADQARMRPYDLPVDQYALYQSSAHGQRLAAGRTDVAVCSDCHGAHDVLPVADPRSRVSRQNVSRTCNTCHQKEAPEAGGPHLRAYTDYLGSVHARAGRGPTCVSCHGGHGAAVQQAGNVGTSCGQCHVQERKALRSGPHGVALARAGLPECASCHGAHAIRPAHPRNLATICVRCHQHEPEAVAAGRRMWADYARALAVLDSASALVDRADAVPINTEDYHARLSQARTYLHEALPAAHAAQAEPVAALTARAADIGEEVQEEVRTQIGHLSVRRWGLVVLWFYVLLTLVVLRYLRKARR